VDLLVPDFFRRGVGEHPRGQVALAQSDAQTPGEVHHDRPIVAGFARRGHGGSDAGDGPLRVGDGAVLLAPGGGGQQEVGVGAGFGVAEGFLHDDEFGGLRASWIRA
jgi:hypothetical protein